jgi:hypothetical protein
MANMQVTDRNSYERIVLSHRSHDRLLHVRSTKRIVITNLILLAIAVPLTIAAANLLDGWADWVVLGGMITITIGAMIAITTLPSGKLER